LSQCDNGQQGVNSITIDLAQDQRIACTFTNSTPPKLKLYSYVQGPPPPSDLNITGDLGVLTMPASSGEKLFEDLMPGEYTFTVTPVEGYKTWISCSPDNQVTENSRTLVLEYGQYIECGINLDKRGSIALEVEVRGNPGPDEWQIFASPTIPNFSIPAAGGEIRFVDLDDNSYNFYVEPVLNFSSSASCSSGETGEWLVAAYVSNGADITCKFIFSQLGILMLPFVVGGPPAKITGTTTLVSRHSDGTVGNGRSEKGATSISADGRFVAFSSNATNLVDNDTNKAVTDVFVHDRVTGQTSLISRHTNGTQGNGNSLGASISADGRFVAYHSQATNLIEIDTNGRVDIFLHDRQTGQTSLISRHTDGTQGNDGSSFNPSISADGRFVAFSSQAQNLIDNDTNNRDDIFIHDRQTGETALISRHTNGTQGNRSSDLVSISYDGRFVAFRSGASNLIDNDTNGDEVNDIFVHDRQSGETSLVSRHTNGTQGTGFELFYSHPSISANGRFVAFASSASNLVDNDANGITIDIFVHDRQTSQTSLISRQTNGTQGGFNSRYPSISADGRFVAFSSEKLINHDNNLGFDIYVRDRQTGETSLISRHTDGEQANNAAEDPSISADGRFVTFISWADNLVDDDVNNEIDIFVHELAGE
jgi:Tol biopolymer transport system component